MHIFQLQFCPHLRPSCHWPSNSKTSTWHQPCANLQLAPPDKMNYSHISVCTFLVLFMTQRSSKVCIFSHPGLFCIIGGDLRFGLPMMGEHRLHR